MSFPSAFDTITLNGNTGFTVTSGGGYFGRSVAGAGDVNGDGYADVIAGGPDVNRAYVIFGRASGFLGLFDTGILNGNNGFTVTSGGGDFGNSVAGAGDVNGDGYADVIAGGPDVNRAYVIFGRASGFPGMFDTGILNGNNGFTVTSGDGGFGFSVSGAGDVNKDGYADVIVGGPQDYSRLFSDEVNRAYVIFGRASGFPSIFDTGILNGNNGFTITSGGGNFGHSVAGAGDVNGDGYADVVVGAYRVIPESGGNRAGRAYVVFGRANGFPGMFDTGTLNGNNGFTMTSACIGKCVSTFGYSVAGAGDINKDGYADIIVGTSTRGASENDPYYHDKAFVVFGKSNFASVFEIGNLNNGILLNGNNGFTITSGAGEFGYSVAGAGDVNKDGYADIMVGGPIVNRAYVIFGQCGSAQTTASGRDTGSECDNLEPPAAHIEPPLLSSDDGSSESGVLGLTLGITLGVTLGASAIVCSAVLGVLGYCCAHQRAAGATAADPFDTVMVAI